MDDQVFEDEEGRGRESTVYSSACWGLGLRTSADDCTRFPLSSLCSLHSSYIKQSSNMRIEKISETTWSDFQLFMFEAPVKGIIDVDLRMKLSARQAAV